MSRWPPLKRDRKLCVPHGKCVILAWPGRPSACVKHSLKSANPAGTCYGPDPARTPPRLRPCSCGRSQVKKWFPPRQLPSWSFVAGLLLWHGVSLEFFHRLLVLGLAGYSLFDSSYFFGNYLGKSNKFYGIKILRFFVNETELGSKKLIQIFAPIWFVASLRVCLYVCLGYLAYFCKGSSLI